MAYDTHDNLVYSTVAVAPSPASSGLTLTVATGDGAKFGSGAAVYNVTIWPINTQPTRANSEIARLASVSGDVLTFSARATNSEPTIIGPRAVQIGDQIAMTITAKTVKDIEANAAVSGTSGGVPYYNSATSIASSALLTNHAPVIGGGAAAAPKTVAAMTTGQQLVGVTGADPVPGAFAISATTPSNPTGTTSATAVMMGLGSTATITPVVTGRIKFTINGDYANTNLAAGTFLQLAYGSGTAPSNGAAATGTAVGSLLGNSQDVAGDANAFSLTWIVSGLTLATAYWLDLQMKTNAGTATATNLAVIAHEI